MRTAPMPLTARSGSEPGATPATPGKRRYERPDVGLSNVVVGVTLGLHIGDIQASITEADQPVRARIAGPPGC